MDFKAFLRINGIRQADLARYLGISDASVSNFVKGRNMPSEDNLAKILSNPDWNCTPLVDSSNIAIATNYSIANTGNGNISANNANSANAENAVLKKEIEMLQKMLDEKDATIEFLKSLINK